ncbi:MAG: tyrosine-type recombinase/integrase [Rhodomicrobium sp.]
MQGKVTKAAVDRAISEARAQGGNIRVYDETLKGFGFTASKTGKATYFIEYKLGGRGAPSRRMTLGPHGPVTAEQARNFAKQKLGEVAKGVDVAANRKAERAKLVGLTFQDAIEQFLAVHAEPTRYWKEKRARLTSGDVKAMMNKPLVTITRRHVADAIDKAKMRSQSSARLLFADLRPFFKWAHEREHSEANPMTGLTPPKPTDARERTLEDYEIKAFWQAASAASWPFASIYKLLLLTGARREEVAGMKWSELDLDANVWMLPGARTKNNRDHRIPLVPQATAALYRLEVAAIKQGHGYKDGDIVFSTTGHSSPSGFSKAKESLDARMRELLGPKFKPWRIHDLRRTCATGMEKLGTETRVIESALNHVSGVKGGLIGVYQRANHQEAVKAAYQVWVAHVEALVSGTHAQSNVISGRLASRERGS